MKNKNNKLSNEKVATELERVSALLQYSKKLEERQQARKDAFQRAHQASKGAMRQKLRKLANGIRPAAEASAHVAAGRDRGVYFARQLRASADHVLRTGELPENRQGRGGAHATNFDNPEVKKYLQMWANRDIDEAKGGLGKQRPTPEKLLVYVNTHLFPDLGIDATISETTAVRWLKWLGFYCTRYAKGIFWDGHERKDVVAARKAYIELMELSVLPFAYQYEDATLSEKAPTLPTGTKVHYPIFHDETCFQANDQTNRLWIREGEQELRSKSRGRNVHVSDFIIE
ncbi:hypothetical protein BD626DRAFT_466472, partial [Schizophyllum amplum]